MSTSPHSTFCEAVVLNPEMTNATARIGAWLVGVAKKSGGFPLELTYRQIREGIEVNGEKIPGTGSRTETVKASLDWMEEQGLLTSVEGKASGFGHFSRIYSMTL